MVLRPFAGLAAECELVALREFVPAATAPAPLAGKAKRPVTIATVLPGAAAAVVREDGTAMIGLQVQTRSSDLSTDYGRALAWSLTAEPGSVLTTVAGPLADEPVRLQDQLDPAAPLDVTLHSDFGWWLTEDEPSAEVTAALERANELIRPTEPIIADGMRGVYWVDPGPKAHIRWVRTEPEDALLAALARLLAAGTLELGDGSRYAGTFRAHGLLVPVWDVDRERHSKEWATPVTELGGRLDTALASLAKQPLTEAERRAREVLAGGQVTVR